jgi:hypothetical protein
MSSPFAKWNLDPSTVKWIDKTRGIGPDPAARPLAPPMPAAPVAKYASSGGDIPDPPDVRYGGGVIGSPNGNAASPGSTAGAPQPFVQPWFRGAEPPPKPALPVVTGGLLGRDPAALDSSTAEESGERLGSAAGAGAAAGMQADTTQAAADEERKKVEAGDALPTMPAGYTQPAHWQPGTHEVHMQHGYSEEEVAPYAQARGEALERGERAGEVANAIGHQQGIAKAAEANAYADLTQRYAEDRQALEERKTRYVDMERQKLDELALQSQQKSDPEAFFKERGTFANVLTTLGLALGSFGASLTKSPNWAMDMINAKVNANIRSQEQNIAQAGKAYDVRSNLFKTNLDTFGDRERAIQATRINGLDQVHSMLAAKLADASLPLEERQNALALQEKVATERGTALKEFMTLTHTAVSEAANERYVPAQTIGGAGGGQKRPEHLVTLPDGTTVQMDSAETAKKAQEVSFGYSQLIDINNRIMQKREQIKALADHPYDNYDKIRSLSRQIHDETETKIKLMSQSEDHSVVREAEHERAEEQQGGSTRGLGVVAHGAVAGSYDRGVDDVLRNQNSRWTEAPRLFVQAGSGPIVQKGYTPDAQGRPQPAARYTGQDVQPPQQLPPKGFKPMDPRVVSAPTAPTPLRESTPPEPVFSGVAAAPAAPGATKNKKGDRLKTGRIK